MCNQGRIQTFVREGQNEVMIYKRRYVDLSAVCKAHSEVQSMMGLVGICMGYAPRTFCEKYVF